jgi:glycosyltransferase involved in cell wall biosynthesis
VRIAFDATPLIGDGTGVATFARGALRALAERDGIDVVAYGLTLRGNRALANVVPANVAVARRPMPAGLLMQVWRRSNTPPIEWCTGPVDIVHGTNFVVPPAKRAAAVVTVHDLTPVRYPELCTPTSLRYPELIRRAAAHGAWVHTPSQSVADEVVDLLDIPVERVRAVLSGLDAPQRGDAARGSALAGANRYILAIGTVEPRKGFPSLVAAFDRLAPDNPGVDLVLAGPDGWGIGAFNAALANVQHRARVRRLGHVTDGERADLLAGAAVLAVPSLYEGFGYPPLEAMAAGTPVVATRAGALPEVLDQGAVLVPVGDVDALAGALATVLDDAGFANALRERGRGRASSFTWDRWADGMVELYRDASGTQG